MEVIVFIDAEMQFFMSNVWKLTFICDVCLFALWVHSTIITTIFKHVVLALIHDDTLRHILFHLCD
jgi:hypothetical protein